MGLLEDAKNEIYLLPSFIGLILLITSGKINEILHFSSNAYINPNFVGLVVISLAFLFWGVQGLIFAKRKQFPFLFLSINGNVAIFLGLSLFLICLLVTIRGISLSLR